ncbi:orotidine-5'-phosphate decarboxylase [Anaplasma platys]|nr:orotidine-5'-phosphate decarboxylase [Anaplasma platys]
MRRSTNPIICALDTTDFDTATSLARVLAGKVAMVKLGLGFFIAHGIPGVRRILDLGVKVFLDLKLHDIPNTVNSAIESIRDLDVEMLTIHVNGGRNMIKGAVDLLKGSGVLPVGVTVLTSMDERDLVECGVEHSVTHHVLKLVDLAVSSGLNAVVCSAHEVSAIKNEYPNLILVVPGIRNAQVSDDQKRVKSVAEALASGADYLVIGRMITASADPASAIDKIVSAF